MKVLWKPKLQIQKCDYCGSKLQITYKDLRTDGMTLRKDCFYCKVCKSKNIISFNKGENKC